MKLLTFNFMKTMFITGVQSRTLRQSNGGGVQLFVPGPVWVIGLGFYFLALPPLAVECNSQWEAVMS